MMTEARQIDIPFTDEERGTLGILAEMIIPASTEYHVPGAGDEIILADILAAATPHYLALSAALDALEALAQDVGAPGFAKLSQVQREDTVATFRRSQPLAAGLVSALTFQCYYRDDRVMRSLAMDARPPYPKGFDVDQGDWSLLDPVRNRKTFWRDAR